MSHPHDPGLVLRQVRRCLGSLVGGSGHLTSYTLDGDSFRIEAVRELGGGLVEYGFSVRGWRVSEFSALAEPARGDDDDPDAGADGLPDMGPDEPELLRGTLVLDADGELAVDGEGRARLSPWRTVGMEWL